MDKVEFKRGDRVRMKYFDGYATGEVTIVTDEMCKVLFDGNYDLDYWYYPKKDLEHEFRLTEETNETRE